MDYFYDFLTCSLCYLAFVGAFYAVVFLFCCLVAVFLAPETVKAYFYRVEKTGLFLLILLIVGDLFACLWGDTIWGWLYRSTDYCGIDFLPFLPITQYRINATFGDEPHGLFGVTLTQLNCVWLAFAIATWGITLFLYRLIARRWFRPDMAGSTKAMQISS